MEWMETQLVVLGAGPGGYTAAFYAADQGLQVTLVEKEPHLGGVCLHEGCIPSKALLHAVHSIQLAEEAVQWGVSFPKPQIDFDRLRTWKNNVVHRLAKGVAQLAQQRKIQVLHGEGSFLDPSTLEVRSPQGEQRIRFQYAILATGSEPVLPPGFPSNHPRILTSREALDLPEIPRKLLIIGAGYIGMELGTVYAGLGSAVTVVELLPSILAQADPDLVRPIFQAARQRFQDIRLNAKVVDLVPEEEQIRVRIESNGQIVEEVLDSVLVAVGRKPRTRGLGLEQAGVAVDEKGWVQVDETLKTTAPTIYAIGDVIGGVMLAHKAAREARIAVDAILNKPVTRRFVIPAVVFTQPELAWCGLTETEARTQGIRVEIAKFPWSASGRAHTCNHPTGWTKLIIDPQTDRLLGVGIVGYGASELIGEAVFALEHNATAKDLAETLHPHPTLSETLMECAELYYGLATHALGRRRPPKA